MPENQESRFVRRNEGDRIVYYRIGGPSESETFWADHWEGVVADDDYYRRFQDGHLGAFTEPFTRFLPRSGPILEAGCGLSQFVIALRSLGYDCRGIDSAATTISLVNRRFPDLPVSVGDVCQLPYEDAELAGYISLGVVEHFQEGPQAPLREARRALRPGGVGIITVPMANPLRARGSLPGKDPLPDGASFYQYAFRSEEFGSILDECGFETVTWSGTGSHYSLAAGSRAFRTALRTFPLLRGIDRILDGTWFARAFGRMQLWVVRAPE